MCVKILINYQNILHPTEFIELGNTIKGHGWPST